MLVLLAPDPTLRSSELGQPSLFTAGATRPRDFKGSSWQAINIISSSSSTVIVTTALLTRPALCVHSLCLTSRGPRPARKIL